MKFEKIDKKEEGKFITRYDITYKTVDDTTKIYEMISRNRKSFVAISRMQLC